MALRTEKPSIAVRCNPLLYAIIQHPDASTPLTTLNYRMYAPFCSTMSPLILLYHAWIRIFAVATLDSVLVYDTQHPYPLCVVGGIHYASLTDLAWSTDGRLLAVSSSDGYCTIISFEAGELGTPLSAEETHSV